MRINQMLEFVRNKHKADKHKGVDGGVLRVLERGDEYLTNLVYDFGKTRDLANRAKIACFYELKQSNVGAIIGGDKQMVRLSIIYYKLLILP